ncbi:MAG: sulfite oxidase [Gemmatimonadota bacterium]
MSEGQVGRKYDEDGLNVGAEFTEADLSITTTDAFFQRSHAPPPDIDPSAWRLRVEGLVERPMAYSLSDLASTFPHREVTATLLCAGLRRAEFQEVRPVPGELLWGSDAVSTGVWGGFALADILRATGVAAEARHVEFVGLDQVTRGGETFGFGGSIHLAKALSDDLILATHLNGSPLPPAHGFPMRAVVPGWIGARSVKWLSEIRLLPHPSRNYFQAEAYRIQREPNPDDPRDVSGGTAMTEVPRNAVILDPMPGASVPAGPLRVRGWAMGEGGRPLMRVEVSMNGGRNWVPASLTPGPGRWTWNSWEATMDMPSGQQVILARASDEEGTMRSSLQESWNVKGYGNNAWYRVEVSVTGS